MVEQKFKINPFLSKLRKIKPIKPASKSKRVVRKGFKKSSLIFKNSHKFLFSITILWKYYNIK